MIISLPYPPTGNTSTRHGKNGAHWTTTETRAYRASVAAKVAAMGVADRIAGPLMVVCEIYPPDRRRRDLDNAWKTISDSLTHAGVWVDDSQINDLRLIRGEVRRGGEVVVTVSSE